MGHARGNRRAGRREERVPMCERSREHQALARRLVLLDPPFGSPGEILRREASELTAVGARRRRTRQAVSLLWALLPLLYGLPSVFTFALAARRLRRRTLAAEGGAYSLVAVVALGLLGGQHGAVVAGAVALVVVVLLATARALMLRRRVFPADATPVATTSLPAVAWTPVFPGSNAESSDPHDPATWVRDARCTGDDGHLLSVPPIALVGNALAGALLLFVDLHFHLTGRAVGVAITLMCSPGLAALFARRVDGENLTFRTWGVSRTVSLREVTAVSTGKAKSFLALTVVGRARPVHLHLYGRGWLLPGPARDHLNGWLQRPDVRFSPSAEESLRGNSAMSGARSKRTRVAWLILRLGPFVGAIAFATRLVLPSGGSTAIDGAPGYTTMVGPKGHPLLVGMPWGRPCAPVVLSLPTSIPGWMQAEIDAVTATARSSGIDVTVTTPSGIWYPSDLFPAGLSDATVEFVHLAVDPGPPRTLVGGHVANVIVGWNASDSPEARHATLTELGATLSAQAIAGRPSALRRSVRQVIAASQGVLSSTAVDSGIANGSQLGGFSASDLAAMRVMSGCPAS